MNRIRFKNKKSGIAIAVVLVFCTAILGLATILVMNTKHQTASHSMQYEQTRALMAAQSGMQLAIYKYRVLPSEFYKIYELERKLRNNPGDSDLSKELAEYESIWLQDLDSENKNSPAAAIAAYLDTVDQAVASGTHGFTVEECKLASRVKDGYNKDYIKIRVTGRFANTTKVLEELVEAFIAN
jgi:type II secretory pathway pseudopilin PulG